MPLQRAPLRMSAIIFVLGVAYALGLQQLMRPFTTDGLHFHPWSSEDMMQTVTLRGLRHNPLETLASIHIQPPGFDAIRAILAQFWPTLSDEAALVQVDRSLYVLGACLLGLLAAITHIWLARLCGARAALLGCLLLLLHPAAIMFATFLDSTMLSALLVLYMYYLLWRAKQREPVSVVLVSAAVLALFFTRSIFQWPAILLFAVCLFLFGLSARKVAVYILITGAVSGLYLAKQSSQFHMLSTSSFGGVSLSNSIGVGMGSSKYAAFLNDTSHATQAQPSMPDVLTSRVKIGGQTNFNHIDYLYLNRQLMDRFEKGLRDMPLDGLLANYAENAAIYFKPTSTYSSGHVIVDHLPWTSLYNAVFSAPVLPGLLLLAFIVWCAEARRRRDATGSLGILLPGLFVLLVSIVSDKGENMRFKFFLEPVMIVFIVSQFALAGRWLRARLRPVRGTS